MFVNPTTIHPLRIGTRGSPLALAQAHEVRDRLSQALGLAHDTFEIVTIKTTGDRIVDRPLKDIGGKGLFTREIEDALLSDQIDIAVHSMKDMPVQQPAGVVIDCHLSREDVRDAFISPNCKRLADLAPGATVGTSSLRRKAQILNRRNDLQVVDFRGNVQTRLEKLDRGVADCTFLAMAGLKRLNLAHVVSSPIEPEEMLPAVAQGAIGVERREDDLRVKQMLESIHDTQTGTRLAAERAFLGALDGSCETPIAGLAEIEGTELSLRGQILRTDGSEEVSGHLTGATSDAEKIGRDLAHMLLAEAGDGFFDWKDS